MPRFDSAPPREGTDSHKWRKYGRGIIPAWVADTDFPAAPPILAALRQRLQHGVFGYCDITEELRETVCEYFLRRWQWSVKPESLLFLPGLGAAIHIVCRMAEGGGILTPSPIYHVFRYAPALAGARRLDAKMILDENERWQLPMRHLQKAADANGANARVLQLCNPHNPNGKIFEREELLALAEFCEKRNMFICADEVHADLILDEDRQHIPIASLDEKIAQRTITLQSPSKAFNVAGLNFAVAVVPDEKLRKKFLQAAAGKVITHLNPFGIAAAQAAWSGECDEWLKKSNAHLRKNRDKLRAAINNKKTPGITMPPLPATYLAWLNVAQLQLPDPPAHFIKHGVGMSPGADFGDPNQMRLNFGCTKNLLQEIITRIRRAAENAA